MIVYIEQVIIDNMVVNFFLLWFCAFVLKEKKSTARFLLASAIGTFFSVIVPFLDLPQTVAFMLKILLCVLIVLVAFKFKNAKKLFATCLSFFVFTLLLGGVVLGFVVNLFPNYSLSNGTLSYHSNIPIGVFILLGFVVFKVFYDVITHVKNKASISKITYEMLVFFMGRKVNITAFLDTGNLLVDSQTSLPVIVINFNAFKQIVNIKTEQFLTGKYQLFGKRYIALNTANKTSNMLVFEVEKVLIKHENKTKVISNPVLGLAVNNFSKNLKCDALIGLKHIEMGEMYD